MLIWLQLKNWKFSVIYVHVISNLELPLTFFILRNVKEDILKNIGNQLFCLLLLYEKKKSGISHYLLCSKEERKSCRLEIAWWWVSDNIIFIFISFTLEACVCSQRHALCVLILQKLIIFLLWTVYLLQLNYNFACQCSLFYERAFCESFCTCNCDRRKNLNHKLHALPLR